MNHEALTFEQMREIVESECSTPAPTLGDLLAMLGAALIVVGLVLGVYALLLLLVKEVTK